MPDNQRIGRLLVSTVGGETVRAYVPPALPPIPPVRLDSVQRLLEQANQALGRLDGLASFLPDLSLFIYAYVRKEALLSSQIEGTQSSLSDLLLFENEEVPGVPIEDVQDVFQLRCRTLSWLETHARRLSAVVAPHSRSSRNSA